MFNDVEILRYSSYATGNSESFSIHDGTYCEVVNITNIGTPQPLYQQVSSPASAGQHISNMHFPPREINLSLLCMSSTPAAARLLRENLYEIFAPFTESMVIHPGTAYTERPRTTLKVTRDDNSERYIDVFLSSPLDFPILQKNSFGDYQGILQLKLIAPYPFWYGNSVTTAYEDENNGDVVKDISLNILGTTWYTMPIFTIMGAATTVQIGIQTNATWNYFNLGAIASGDEVTVNASVFTRNVFDDSGDINWSYATSTPTDLQKMLIAPDWIDTTGFSSVSISATGQDASTKAKIQYTRNYLGI